MIDDLEATILEMPYKEKNLSMVFVLPHDITGLSSLSTHINESSISNIFWQLENPDTFKKVNVVLPKFNLTNIINVFDKLSEVSIEN